MTNFFKNWSIVGKQYYISFRYTAQCFNILFTLPSDRRDKSSYSLPPYRVVNDIINYSPCVVPYAPIT